MCQSCSFLCTPYFQEHSCTLNFLLSLLINSIYTPACALSRRIHISACHCNFQEHLFPFLPQGKVKYTHQSVRGVNYSKMFFCYFFLWFSDSLLLFFCVDFFEKYPWFYYFSTYSFLPFSKILFWTSNLKNFFPKILCFFHYLLCTMAMRIAICGLPQKYY